MKIRYTNSFNRDYGRLPKTIQDRVDREIELLASSPGHPSLRFQKMEGTGDFWEARIPRGYRITLAWSGDTAVLRRVGWHNVLRNP